MRDDEPDRDERGEITDAARDLASGADVDWPALQSSAGDPEARALIRGLQDVERIAAFHRSLPVTPEQTAAPAEPLTTWGSLTILAELGRGSSGRVYRGRDPKLDRDVALKVLDPGLAPDSPRARDVIDEGRHLARLRHPNIVIIHGADRVDGRVGLEMELVIGRTLAEIVQAQGPFAADEAALICRDVSRALAAVHRAGLVHRDVKAQNVIRERGGRIVLMDFGAGRLATVTESLAIAGTPLYLAPEVLAGGPPTPRSDLYSLGVLLYYLVSGAFPIQAATIDELREAHRSGLVTRLRDARPDLPERFIQLVEHALAPDPAHRIDSAGTFEAELTRSLGSASNSPSARARPWPVVTGVGIALAAAVLTWAGWPSGRPQVARFEVPVAGHLTIPHGPGSREFALSPDGTSLVYSAMGTSRKDAHISLRRIDEVEAHEIVTPGGQPFFSPDGTRVGLYGQKLTTVRLAVGGTLNTLTDRDAAGGGSWGADGKIVFSSQGDLWRVPEAGGEPVRLTWIGTSSSVSADAAIRPQVLPTGDILFTLRRHGGLDFAIAILKRDGSVATVVDHAASARYMPGYLVYVTGEPPWITAAPFDLTRLAITGGAAAIQALTSGSHWFDVSPNGTLAFAKPDPPGPEGAPALVWVDRDTGREEPLAIPAPGSFQAYSLRVSHDGRRVAFTTRPHPLLETVDFAQPGPLTIASLERGGRGTPLIADPVHPLAWSRDDTRITYRTLEGAIAWRRADGSGGEEILAAPSPELNCNTGDWSPDGRVLLLGCGSWTGAESHARLIKLAFPSPGAVGKAPAKPEVFLEERGQGAPRFSEDGRLVAYSSNIEGELGARVFVREFGGSGRVEPVSPKMGRIPMWRGRELFYMSPGPTVAALRPSPAFGLDPPTEIGLDFSGYDTFNAGRLVFWVSPDGRRFLLQKRASGRGGDYITSIVVVLHWIEDVKTKLGVR